MNNDDQHIPSGYKPSPLGPIPEDWEVKRIGDFGKVITGNTPPTEDTDNYGNAYKFVSPADISDSKYIEATEKHLSEKGFSISRQMPKGTVLFTCIGSTIGKCAIANESLTSNQQINAIICDSKHSGEFLYYELSHRSNRIKQIAGEQAVPIINKSTFENYKVLCPPFEEQKSIAKILSIWDTAIVKQAALIEQLTLRKRGLMQQLLTGKKRLKGFEGGWKRIKAGEIFKSISVKGNGSEVLLSATQEHGVIPRDQLEGRVTMPTGDTNSFKLVEVGDFVISLRSFQGGLEYSEHRGIVSPAYTVLKPIVEIDKSFYRYYFKSAEFIGHLAIAVIGIRDGKQISYEDFCFVKIPYPNIEEQKAISTVLLQADKEIEIQKQKLAAMQEQKKGLMQVLLTGKRRVNNE